MERFALLFRIALRNLRSHRLKTFVVASIVALGAFIMVFGLAALDSIELAMRRSVTSSFTGHVQVWSDETDAKFQLVNLGSEQADIGELPDFAAVEAQLTEIAGVKEVVPMATGFAATSEESEVDSVLAELREAIDTGNAGLVESAKDRVRLIAGMLGQSLDRELAVSSTQEPVQKKLAVVRKVQSDEFWANIAAEADEKLFYLDSEFAPLAPSGRTIYLEYLATDPGQFARVFDRFQVVDGEMIPDGRRGLMISKRHYEGGMKMSVARELDRLKERFEAGERFSASPQMQSRVNWLTDQSDRLALQIDAQEAEQLRPRLQKELGVPDVNIAALLGAFLDLTDDTFLSRVAFFYETIAPHIELYPLLVGDTVVLQAFTENGYMKSVAVKFWGTFEFKGLEGSNIAHGYDILDLVTFRDLYGKMSSAQVAELTEIRDAVGVETISQDSVEDALFGEESGPIEREANPNDTIAIPDQLGEMEALDERVYDRAEMRDGLALNVALMLDDPEAVSRTIDQINELEGLQATGWKAAAGIVGQFVYVITGVLYFANLVIFLLAMLVINNSMMMAMMERVKEIGTIRALGGQRDEVLWMVLLESLMLSLVAGAFGAALAVGLVTWLGSVGIPAPSSIVVFLFGGDRLYPVVGLGHVIAGVGGVTLVTVLSSLYPARIATRVQPIVAMRGDRCGCSFSWRFAISCRPAVAPSFWGAPSRW